MNNSLTPTGNPTENADYPKTDATQKTLDQPSAATHRKILKNKLRTTLI